MPRPANKPTKRRQDSVEHAEGAPSTYGDLSNCVLCRDKRPLTLPEALVEAVRSDELVLFAGAGTGISTETRNLFPVSLRAELTSDLALELGREAPSNESFAALASAYEQAFGRKELIQRIRARLDYAQAFPAVYSAATAFHKELSTIPGMHLLPIRHRPHRAGHRRRVRKQPLLELVVVHPLWQWRPHARPPIPLHIVRHRRVGQARRGAHLPTGQALGDDKSKDFSDLAHDGSGSGHRHLSLDVCCDCPRQDAPPSLPHAAAPIVSFTVIQFDRNG